MACPLGFLKEESMTKLAQELDEPYILITNSQDVEAVLESIGRQDLREEYPALFVLVGEGEYLEVWGSPRLVPLLTTRVERIL